MRDSMKNKLPDPRAIEKRSYDLARLMQSQQFKSKKQAQDYLNRIIENGGDSEAPPKNAVSFAQDIMYEAWDADTREERIKLAKEALSVSADCADVYNLLAEEQAQTLEEAKEFYQKGTDAGRRALGEKIFEEDEGHFWGYVPTRPYLRARAGLMDCLWQLKEYDEAINHGKEILRLNVRDNQGIRYILIAYLAELKRYDELEEILNKRLHKYDCAAEWLYTKTLLTFVKQGNSKQAQKEFKSAFEKNKYVPEYITGKKPIPKDLPDRITIGGEDEAFCCADRFLKAWENVPGAIEWLKDQTNIKIYPKTGRN